MHENKLSKSPKYAPITYNTYEIEWYICKKNYCGFLLEKYIIVWFM